MLIIIALNITHLLFPLAIISSTNRESIPAMISSVLRKEDKKISYYREHCHALASGVDAGKVMAELCMKDGGTCRGAGGSMHLYDKEHRFQGGWALVAEQLPYAAGAAKSILLDRELGLIEKELENGDIVKVVESQESKMKDDRIAVVFIGDGGAQNGRIPELLNTASKLSLPLLIVVIDNGRAINTFTEDVAANTMKFSLGEHYGVPGLLVNGLHAEDVVKAGQAVTSYVRSGKGPALMQIHTYRFMGHSPADPEHERGRKEEKAWARSEQDPIKEFEAKYTSSGLFTQDELNAAKKEIKQIINDALSFAEKSPEPNPDLAKELEYPTPAGADYNAVSPPLFAEIVNKRTISSDQMENINSHIDALREKAIQGHITIAEAVNLAIHEEMLADPLTTMQAEDLQAGSSYGIPGLTQQTYGPLRASDEIIDEGHFIGKSIGEAMNGYRAIVELMNTNFGIYAMAEIASCGNTYLQSGGQFKLPITILGAGGTAPDQALGAEHSQPLHAYIMGVPGLKIATASSPEAAYGITKSVIRDDGPCFLLFPVKLMKEIKGSVNLGQCMPLKAALLHTASDESVKSGNAVTVLSYLHGVKESMDSIEQLKEEGMDIDLIELRTLKPLDMDTIRDSLQRTNKLCILDESTRSGGVGATISSRVCEEMFDLLDAPVVRLAMEDTPVPYASSMEKKVVKRSTDLVEGVTKLCKGRV
jgi:pyruvate/2-oxoglutarate/acetoin dehydrogenase E1 component/TPP-dependent pyruvate/acetoin dehydrogenase alpha subunit